MPLRKIKTSVNKFTRRKVLLAFIAVLFAFFISIPPFLSSNKVAAGRQEELQAKSSQLQAAINANNAKIADLNKQAQTLQVKLVQLQTDIDRASQELALTAVKIEELKDKLDKTQKELDRQKGLLKASMRALYKKRGASTVELLVASDSFSQFIDDQEYLERLKLSIQDSTEQVIKLKQELQKEQAQAEELKKQQEIQKSALVQRQQEQQNLLAQTQSDESKYKAIVEDQKKALEQAESELRSLISSGSLVSQGHILRGQRVGSMGSTGYSTGPHVHFTVTHNGEYVNPRAGGNSLTDGLGWPAPNSGWGHVSQEFGCVAPAYYYSVQCENGLSFHSGLDIFGSYGDPIVAADDGEIVFRACKAGLGFLVIVDHGGGRQTWYPHMIAPSGQTSGYC